MKKIISVICFLFLTVALQNCSEKPPTQTINALIQAYDDATTSSLKYNYYADTAREEGHHQIANLFEAISKSDAIHAHNLKKVLESLQIIPGSAVIGLIDINSTNQNLSEVIDYLTKESSKKYPDMMKSSEEENIKNASKAFRWAKDSAKDLISLIKSVQKKFNNNDSGNIDNVFYVCPTCGKIYIKSKLTDACDLCSTNSEKYIIFELKNLNTSNNE